MAEQVMPQIVRSALVTSVVPPDEVGIVYDALYSMWKAYLPRAPALTASTVRCPESPQIIDDLLYDQLVALARADVVSPLAKLAWISYALIADSYAEDDVDSSLLVYMALHVRIYEADFLLSEYRKICEHEEGDVWVVTMLSPDGKTYFQRPRVFPMWGVEVENNLNNYQRARAWYREALMKRKIVR